MTGSADWAYFAATRFMLGIRPDFDNMVIDPCVSTSWPSFTVRRVWRNAVYNITVENPDKASKGVKECKLNGQSVTCNEGKAVVPAQAAGSENQVLLVMGK
jgi:N,N'-diacetylchitobiose phosphorylase